METALKFLTGLMITFSLLFINTSCEGEDGKDGINGQDGNSSVITSGWSTPDSDSYSVTVTNQAYFFLELDLPAPEITQEILDNGVVLVYARLNAYPDTVWSDNQVGLLPITIMSGANSITQIDTWAANISVGNIKIHITNPEQVYTFHTDEDDPSSFRYVIIPSIDLISKSVTSFSDYEGLTELYNVKD